MTFFLPAPDDERASIFFCAALDMAARQQQREGEEAIDQQGRHRVHLAEGGREQEEIRQLGRLFHEPVCPRLPSGPAKQLLHDAADQTYATVKKLR